MSGPYQQQQQPYPQQQQSYPPQHQEHPPQYVHLAPKKPFFEMVVSKEKFGLFFVIGAVLVFLGLALIHLAPMVTNYNATSFAGMTDQTAINNKRANDLATKNTLIIVGDVILDLGVAGVVALLVMFGALREDLQKGRSGVFIAAGLVLLARVMLAIGSISSTTGSAFGIP
ncbi:MAG: hypothetical protein HZB92_06550 [Euryarchaeota archaeon]|nr:hypothetical protein [Euryarchaeota archaeon]